MIQINETHFKILKEILSKYNVKFYAYGSRIKNKARQFSDLDICIVGDFYHRDYFSLKDELVDSDISIKIDLQRWKDLNKDLVNKGEEYKNIAIEFICNFMIKSITNKFGFEIPYVNENTKNYISNFERQQIEELFKNIQFYLLDKINNNLEGQEKSKFLEFAIKK